MVETKGGGVGGITPYEKAGRGMPLLPPPPVILPDAVHALNCKAEGEIVGEGTGDVKVHLDALAEANIEIMVSGMSAKARGYDQTLLDGFNASFAMPDKLIQHSLEADSVLCY